MPIYQNTRIWRLVFLFWLFFLPGLVLSAAALAGIAIGNVGLMVLGFILAPILLLAAVGIALFARNFVVVLTRDGDALKVETWSMRGGRSESFPFATARIGDEQISKSEDDDDPGVIVDTALRRLYIEGRRSSFILDCTDQPDLSRAVAVAFRR